MKRIRAGVVPGVVGGLVVATLGFAAIATGVVETSAPTTTTTVTAPPSPRADEQAKPVSRTSASTVGQIYDDVSAGVAFIEAGGVQPEGVAPSPFGGGGTATGSGFLIDEEGHLLTNAHVVADAQRIEVRLGSEDAEPLDAELVGADPSTDVAVLKVDPSAASAEPLPLGDSEATQVGDSVIAIGSPFGLEGSLTAGIVSALDREIPSLDGYQISGAIQTDAPINPGNSGGPLLNAAGEVIGINSQIESSGQGNVGIGFAVPIATAQEVAEQLISGGEVEHAYLGISGGDLTPELARALNLPGEADGALVGQVTPGGPAAEAGLEGGQGTVSVEGQRLPAGGDVITAIDGEPISGMDDVIAAVDSREPGDEIELTVVGDAGEERTVTVTLDDRPEGAAQ